MNLSKLQEIVKETNGSEFRLTCNSTEWRCYIVRSRTNFSGTLEEVINLTIEEFLSYRVKSKQNQSHKFFKPYTYEYQQTRN